MRRTWSMAILLCCSSGCTMLSLERHTAAQSGTATDLRYREVMDNLARTAANPSALPCYATIFTGSVVVSDTFGLAETTMWQHVRTPPVQNGFMSQNANPSEIRQFNQNWALDPIIHAPKLEAMRACAHWILFGQQSLTADEMDLLVSPDVVPPGPGRHFNVADRLAQLPACWLHVGRLRDVPHSACYKAHCGHTWVWVNSEDMKGLADFTLVLQDIGRVDVNNPILFNIPPAYTVMKFLALDSPIRAGQPDETQVRVYAQVTVDPNGRLQPDYPYVRQEQASQQSLAHLRSLINLAIPTPK